MRRNVEIKARLREPERVARSAFALVGNEGEVFLQEDTFFASLRGRLKLRKQGDGSGELIWYDRADAAEPTESRYIVASTADPEGVRKALERALGLRGVVRKRRRVLIAGRTRIHLDEVEGLGTFLELEVVLDEGEAEESGRREVLEWMTGLGVTPDDLLEPAYVDLMERGCG